MDQSTPSVQDSHVKTLASLEKALVSKALEAVSGLRSFDLLARLDLQSSCWKMCQQSLFEDLDESLATWPRSGIMLSGIAYGLPTSALGIGETDGSWLPTPNASADAKGCPKNRYWGSKTYRGHLREYLRNGQDDPTFPHPRFVELVMGFPIGHTDLLPSEMPLSRSGRSLSRK